MNGFNRLAIIIAMVTLLLASCSPSSTSAQAPLNTLTPPSVLTPTKSPSSTPSAQTEPKDESPVPDKFTLIQFATADENLEGLLQREAEKAKALGRSAYVEFYADWCPPCQALRKSLTDKRMIDAFAGTYIIQLNLDAWKDHLVGTKLEVSAIPAFFELDSHGKPTGRTITGAAWGEDIPENMAPPLKEFFSANTH